MINQNEQEENDWKDEKFGIFIYELNKDYPKKKHENREENEFKEEIVTLLFSLAKGVFRNLTNFEAIVNQ